MNLTLVDSLGVRFKLFVCYNPLFCGAATVFAAVAWLGFAFERVYCSAEDPLSHIYESNLGSTYACEPRCLSMLRLPEG